MDRKMNGRLQKWLVHIVVCLLFGLRTESLFVDITYVRSAVAKGAVCLDGSPPAYHIHRGFGAGINKWLVHLEGGAWCQNVKRCLARKNTQLGSSKKMAKRIAFAGILSNKKLFNPYFYNWNRVRVRYCDGSSFTGDIEAVDPVTKLHYRGGRVFDAVMEELFAEGMKNAENAVLSGCSAGGLASMLHCDKFKALFQSSTGVKCLADAGFFINVKDVSGGPYIENFYENVVRTHGSAKNLPTSCTSKMKPGLCFFPQNIAQGIQTPLFIVNAAYDSWQIRHILVPNSSDPNGTWRNCRDDLDKCTSSQLKILQGFRSDFLKALIGLGLSTSRAYFINSCYAHCQTEYQDTWFWSDSPVLDGKTIAEAVGDWYYDRSPFQKIDCPYPCDKTCRTNVVDLRGHAVR